jgi:hypothetical protein
MCRVVPRYRGGSLEGKIHVRIGMWLSLVERCVRDAEVAGSNPVIPTIPTSMSRDQLLWLPEQDGFRLRLLTGSEGDYGDLWLYCPDGTHFGIAYEITGSFAVQ